MVNATAKSLKLPWRFEIFIIVILLLGFAWKLALMLVDAFPFNADEAIVGLMGRHILAGARPTFFYGQAYMGSLDAFLVALGFLLFGTQVWVIRLVQALLFLGTILTAVLIALRLHGDKLGALISGLLLAIPTVNVTLYTTVSLGGYGEALLIGNLAILLTLRLIDHDFAWGNYALLGFFAGLGVWAFGLTLIYTIPCLIVLVIARRQKHVSPLKLKNSLSIFLGFIIGLSPVLFWGFRNGWGILFQELLGSAIAGASHENIWISMKNHGLNLILFGPTVVLGIRPPWSTEILAPYLVPFALIFWIFVAIHIIFRRNTVDDRKASSLLGLVSLSLIVGFVLTPFGADPSGRYFLPLWIPLAIFAGDFIVKPQLKVPAWMRWTFFVGVLVFNSVSTWQTAQTSPDRMTTQFDAIARIDHQYDQQLIDFLLSIGETRGYSNYWTAYPIAFLSNEEVIYYPALPYHLDFRYTSRDNRYETFTTQVDQSERVAYITANHSPLENALRDSFRRLSVSWKEKKIGDYVVFYHLSDRVDIHTVGSRWMEPGS